MTNLATLPVPGPLPAACVRLPHPLLCLGFIGLLLLNPMSARTSAQSPSPAQASAPAAGPVLGPPAPPTTPRAPSTAPATAPAPRPPTTTTTAPALLALPVLEADLDYAEPVALGVVRDPRINEASGIVASRRYPGLYYTHNDSGDEARVFLLDRHARTRAVVRLRNAVNVDCEDIAMAPGAQPGVWDVCLADIGDNFARRSEITIYRFPEPNLPPEALDNPNASAPPTQPARFDLAAPVLTTDTTAYRCKYPDPPSDAEGFAVHPRTGDGYIFTKRMDGRCFIYKLAAPWHPDALTVVPRLTILESPGGPGLAQAITAADISPDGRRLALRCYTGGWEYRLPAGTPDTRFESIFKQVPDALELPLEPQGEALGYEADGRGLVLISENGPRNQPPTLWQVPRRASGWRSPGIEAKNRP